MPLSPTDKARHIVIACGKHRGVRVQLLVISVEPEFLYDNWTSQIPCPMCVHEAVLKDDSLTSRSWTPSPRPA